MDRANKVLVIVALAWTVATGVVLLIVPSSSSVTMSSDGSGALVESSSEETLLGREGALALALLAVPVLLTLAAALAGRGTWARPGRLGAGAALLAVCLVAAASIGLVYVPAAVLLLVAGVRTRPGRWQRPAVPSAV